MNYGTGPAPEDAPPRRLVDHLTPDRLQTLETAIAYAKANGQGGIISVEILQLEALIASHRTLLQIMVDGAKIGAELRAESDRIRQVLASPGSTEASKP